MVKRFETKHKNAKVYFRILPMVKMCWQHVKILDDRKTVFLRCLQDFETGREALEPSYWRFETDGVFYNNTQREIYETVMMGVLDSVLEGNNAVILAYGQTGTGKSLSVCGTENSYEDRGIIPRIIMDIFAAKRNLRGKQKICYQMSYVEATKRYIRDLLKDDGDTFDMNSAKNISAVIINSEDQALRNVFRAEGRKTTVKGSVYNSHAASTVFTLTVTMKLQNRKTVSKVHVVDLAGADTIGNLSCSYKNVFEVGCANLAKSYLEQFLLILIENVPEHVIVKQRLSILIHYLRDSLNASSLLRFIGHMSTAKDDLRITISMLRFGQILRGLKVKRFQANVLENEDFKMQTLECEINALKRDRDLNAMFTNRDLSSNVTQDRLQHVQNVTEEYLRDKISELTLLNIADVQVAFKVFKSMYNTLEAERSELANKRAHEESSKRDSLLSSSFRSARRINVKSRDSSVMRPQLLKAGRKSSSKQTLSHIALMSEAKENGRKSLTPSVDSAETEKSLRRSKTGSKILKSSSRSRRKMSVASTDRISEEEKAAEVPVKMPDYEEAWKTFTEHQDYQYEKIRAEVEVHEAKTKEGNVMYLREVKKLRTLRAAFSKASDDVLKAQMLMDIDPNDYAIAKEIKLREGLKEAERNLVEQQEKVLGLQAELRLHLQLYQDARKRINDAFESFCCDSYKTLVPNLDGSFDKVNEIVLANRSLSKENLDEAQDVEETKKISEQYNELMRYETLKRLVNKQKEKRLRKEILDRKWIRSCKN